MVDLINMVCPPGVGCPLTSGFGLPEVLLWVLTFAVVYTFISRMIGKKPAVLASLAIGFFVLMATPAALITAIAGMSTGFIALLVGLIVVVSIFNILQPAQTVTKTGPDGKPVTTTTDWLAVHSTAVSIVLLLLGGLIFWTYGGAQLIGVTSLPAVGAVPWILVLIGAAVLWMLS